jgi:hypothetical protein
VRLDLFLCPPAEVASDRVVVSGSELARHWL